MNINVYFLVLAMVGVGLPIFAPSDNLQIARRMFWAGLVIAGVCSLFITYPPNLGAGFMLSGLAVGMMLMRAYFSSSYLKFRGKIYAFSIADSRPDPQPGERQDRSGTVDPAPDSYGGMASAAKSWWLMVPALALCTYMLADYLLGDDKPSGLLALSAAAVLVILAISRGHEDGSWGYPIARRQRLQFAIITVVTAGVFAVLYLPAYYAGRRWPLRPKRSMEYRAHPRHWR